MRESDILHENGRFWVGRDRVRGRSVLRVFENGVTHSVGRATIDLGGDAGLPRAITECNRRARAARKAVTDARVDASMPWRHP